ncbi:MAG: DUF4190 domain-containing protein [Chloroflexi bacterium]|nr:DUF4190 domain-containing protein [Chloroflexota bacterium]
MDSNKVTSPTNRHSVISLILGVLTIVTFCGGVIIPLPFTSFICAPTSLLLGVLALIYGTISLNRIRKHNESGRPMAWIGIFSGGIILLCVLCMVLALISLFMFAPDSLPPFLQNHSI